MSPVDWVAILLALGLIAVALGQQGVMRRAYRSLDQAAAEARFWRGQAQRAAGEAAQLRRHPHPVEPPPPARPVTPRPPTPDPGTPIADQLTAELPRLTDTDQAETPRRSRAGTRSSLKAVRDE